jgi:hypothetical protein
MDPVTPIDRYEPDYDGKCEICGNSPLVTGARAGQIVYRATMCGPCLWNEPKAADPGTWNGEAAGA